MPTTREKIRERLVMVIDELPDGKLEEIVDFAEYLKSREEWDATQELLNDPGMRADIDEGIKQSKCNEGRSWKEIKNRV